MLTSYYQNQYSLCEELANTNLYATRQTTVHFHFAEVASIKWEEQSATAFGRGSEGGQFNLEGFTIRRYHPRTTESCDVSADLALHSRKSFGKTVSSLKKFFGLSIWVMLHPKEQPTARHLILQ